MQIVFIIFGLIIVFSFITGLVLTMKEKKKTAGQVLTDDPKILFENNDENKVTSVEGNVVSNTSVATSTVENTVTESTDSTMFKGTTPVNSDVKVVNNEDKFVLQDVIPQPVNVTLNESKSPSVINSVPVASNTLNMQTTNVQTNDNLFDEELI